MADIFCVGRNRVDRISLRVLFSIRRNDRVSTVKKRFTIFPFLASLCSPTPLEQISCSNGVQLSFPTALPCSRIATVRPLISPRKSRNSRKGLDVSPALLELFGGASAEDGTNSVPTKKRIGGVRGGCEENCEISAIEEVTRAHGGGGPVTKNHGEDRAVPEGNRSDAASWARAQRSIGGGAVAAEGARCKPQCTVAPMMQSGGARGHPPILIRQAEIVNEDGILVGDVLIEDGVIKQISSSISAAPNVRVIDAKGKMLLPAGIDVHTEFFAVNSADDFAQGTKSAIIGGTTMVVEVIVPQGNESLLAAFERAKSKAAVAACCSYGLSMTVNRWNADVQAEMNSLVKEKGVNSFVLELEHDCDLLQALQHCRSIGALARILPENRCIVPFLEKQILAAGVSGPEGFLQSRPEQLEAEMVQRLGVLSQLSNCPISILCVSSALAAQAVGSARSTGSLIQAEIAVASLASDGTHYFNKCLRHAAGHLMACPLRPDQRAPGVLANHLATNPLAVVTSDHRAFKTTEPLSGDFTKMTRGVAAVEERMAVAWERSVYAGHMDHMRFVAVTSSNPAKLLNIYPKKGRIAVGSDADIVLWDSTLRRRFSCKTQCSAADFSVFEGFAVHGAPCLTISQGRIVFENGVANVTPGSAAFCPLLPQSPYLFTVVQQRERVNSPEAIDRSGDGKNDTVQHNGVQAERANKLDARGGDGGAPMRVKQPPGGKSSVMW